MAEDKITQDKFDRMLTWLGIDGASAAEKYETIRGRLIRLFIGRGCHEAEALADLTIDRVTLKVDQIDEDYVGDPAAYFYGVANKVYFEWRRQQGRARTIASVRDEPSDPVDHEAEFRCLESCLAKLTEDVREMIIEYYRGEKKSRIVCRQRMAAKLGITTASLQVRTNRVRKTLLVCMRRCLGEN